MKKIKDMYLEECKNQNEYQKNPEKLNDSGVSRFPNYFTIQQPFQAQSIEVLNHTLKRTVKKTSYKNKKYKTKMKFKRDFKKANTIKSYRTMIEESDNGKKYLKKFYAKPAKSLKKQANRKIRKLREPLATKGSNYKKHFNLAWKLN